MQFDHEPTLEELRAALEGCPSVNPRLPDGVEVEPLSYYVEWIVPICTRGTWRPYPCVNVRLRIGHDLCASAGEQMTITTEEVPCREGFVKYKARVEIPIAGFGIADGDAIGVVGKNAKGADTTNPDENAQTSAIGRALGNLGIGLIPGGGIASAEEMQQALKRQGQQPSPRSTPPQQTTERPTAPTRPSEPEPSAPPCPNCGVETAYRTGTSKDGKVWAGWFCPKDRDECDGVVWQDSAKSSSGASDDSGTDNVADCPKCLRPMRIVEQDGGNFLGCIGYRDTEKPCKTTQRMGWEGVRAITVADQLADDFEEAWAELMAHHYEHSQDQQKAEEAVLVACWAGIQEDSALQSCFGKSRPRSLREAANFDGPARAMLRGMQAALKVPAEHPEDAHEREAREAGHEPAPDEPAGWEPTEQRSPDDMSPAEEWRYLSSQHNITVEIQWECIKQGAMAAEVDENARKSIAAGHRHHAEDPAWVIGQSKAGLNEEFVKAALHHLRVCAT